MTLGYLELVQSQSLSNIYGYRRREGVNYRDCTWAGLRLVLEQSTLKLIGLSPDAEIEASPPSAPREPSETGGIQLTSDIPDILEEIVVCHHLDHGGT